MTMTNEPVARLCKEKEQELLYRYFGNLVKEAAIEQPETIGEYTKDLPIKIEAEYRAYLEGLWQEYAPEELKDSPLVLEEKKLRKLMTDDNREAVNAAYQEASKRTLWERICKTNHKDVARYKSELESYTRELLMVMRHDFLEEITGRYIESKAFEDD